MAEPAPELAIAGICRELFARGRRFALVGGLAVSVRAEVRFTRDVDLAVHVLDDADAEQLVYDLRLIGYTAVASVEHDTRHRRCGACRRETIPVSGSSDSYEAIELPASRPKVHGRACAGECAPNSSGSHYDLPPRAHENSRVHPSLTV
jgi:hypothetical protein